MLQRLLHGGVVLFVRQGFTGQPFGGCDQRGLQAQVVHVPIAAIALAFGGRGVQRHQGIQQIQRGRLGVAGAQQLRCCCLLARGGRHLQHQRHGQRQALGRGLGQFLQRLPGVVRLAQAVLDACQLDAWAWGLRCRAHGLVQQLAGGVLLGVAGLLGRLFAQVVRQAAAEVALVGGLHAARDLGRLHPVARAFVDGQQGQAGFGLVGRAFQAAQRFFGAVQQTGLQEVLGQSVLSALAVVLAQVGARQQVFVHAHGAVVFTAATEQIAQGEVQVRGLGVVLHRFNEGVDGLVLLLVEQEVKAFEISLRRLAVVLAHLAQIHARGQPTEGESHGQAKQNPAEVKFHGSSGGVVRRGRALRPALRVRSRSG